MQNPESGAPSATQSVAGQLNQQCACRTLDTAILQSQLEKELPLAGMYNEIVQTRPGLFSATTVFISSQQLEQMASLVKAVEAVVALPAFQTLVLNQAPAIARHNPGPHGVFMGYDFHLGEQGPQLIEINTNAGGALLNAVLAKAQMACCNAMDATQPTQADINRFEDAIIAMFREEWRLQAGNKPLTRIAIVDDNPEEQYLYPEFRLFEHLFTCAGIEAVIADPEELQWQGGELTHAGKPIDMIYNRLTDFYLEQAGHTALRSAYEAGAVVVTPHPHAHALYANKRNLALLTDKTALDALQVPDATCDRLLTTIPRTRQVLSEQADALWAQRKKLFFKPATGYGSKATYRGDKLTRRVWEDILAGNYIAQDLIPPSERLVQVDHNTTDLKLDIRAYVYDGNIQLVAARLYSGQTTNFRTEGGGFAPVFIVPEWLP